MTDAPDPDRMAALHAAAFDDARPWSTAEFRDLLGQRGVFALGDAEAFALVRVLADEAELLTLATHPDTRRQGRARALMARWEAEAARRGAARAFLEVAADNAPACALYKVCGYAQTGLRRAYYRRTSGGAADALIMSRVLTPGHGDAG